MDLAGLGLQVDEAKETPAFIASYEYGKLVEKQKSIEARFANKPGLFTDKKVAARDMYCARYLATKAKQERRAAIAKQKYDFYLSLKPFDADWSKLDFEMRVCEKR
jgi:hypothetical protein